MVKKVLANIYIYLILFLMYLPILVLIAFSLSTNDVISLPRGDEEWAFNFGFDLYKNLFNPNLKVAQEIWTAVGNTLIIAVTAALISVILGTLGAIGVFYSKKRTQKGVEIMTQIPIVNAEIVIALSLTIMFVFLETRIFKTRLFSYWTLLIGHVVLSLPFVYLSVKPKLQQMDPNLYEASLDLGAKPSQGLVRVIIPQILPGILSGFILSITLSLDDFIVTAFTRGSGLLSGEASIETLSTYIQATLKKHTVPPELRALSFFIFLAVLAIVIGIMIFKKKNEVKIRHRELNR